MKDALKKISAYNMLIDQVEILRKQTYSHDNPNNAQLLIDIWNGLVGNAETNRMDKIELSNRWKDLGFQGNDPSTDFRGMGMLGLSCLKYNCILDLQNSIFLFNFLMIIFLLLLSI